MKLSRREMIQTTAAAMALPALPLGNVVTNPESLTPNPKFFTPAEFALVDELSDMIIPPDARSGGARSAGVAAYLDTRLTEEQASSPSPDGGGGQGVRWRAGVRAVEDLSRELHGRGFMESTPEQRLAVLTRMAAGESDPKSPAERFFKEIKGATIGAYYTSRVGIHDDQQYKGNTYQTGEYAGSTPT